MKLTRWLLLGGTAVVFLQHRRRAAAPRTVSEPDVFPADMQVDSDDPVQGFDEANELRVEPLAVDAMSHADAETAQDLASLETDLDEAARELDTPSETTLDALDAAAAGSGTGELYGVHTVPAVDRDLSDDRDSFDRGENWLEALEASAAENGAEPERELDIVDDVDEPPHPTDTRDIPVADRGSAGPGGL